MSREEVGVSDFPELLNAPESGSIVKFVADTCATWSRGTRDPHLDAGGYSRLLRQFSMPAALYDMRGEQVGGNDLAALLPQQLPSLPAFSGATFFADDSAGLIFVNSPRSMQAGRLSQELRVVIAISPDMLDHLTASLGRRDRLTQGEYALVCDLLAGRSLKESAQRQQRSYETRRKQLRSVLAKLDAASQADIVRLFSLAVLDHVVGCLAGAEADDKVPPPLLQHGGMALMHDVQLRSGRTLRVFELGPSSGRPVVFFHPLLMPVMPFPWDVARLFQMNVRWIIPSRHFYDLSDRFGTPDYLLTDFANDVGEMLDLFGHQRAGVVAGSTGVVWAARFAALHAGRVERIVCVSSPVPSCPTGSVPRKRSFQRAFYDFICRHPRAGLAYMKFFASVGNTRSQLHGMFRHAYAASRSDVDVLDMVLTSGGKAEWANYLLKHCSHAIAVDLLLGQQSWRQDMMKYQGPVVFIHGADDKMSDIADVEAFIAPMRQPHLVEIKNAGQMLFARHFATILSQLGNGDVSVEANDGDLAFQRALVG